MQFDSMGRPTQRVFTAPKKTKKRMAKNNKTEEGGRGRTRTSGKTGYSKTNMAFYNEGAD